MKFLGVVLFLFSISGIGHAHNIKLIKSQSSDLNTTGIDAAINNESYIDDTDTFLEGYLGYSCSQNNLDESTSDNKNIGLQVITPNFLSLGLSTSQYGNTSAELQTKTLSAEIGKKIFYGDEKDDFKPNFGVRLKAERIGLDQSKTFVRRKFDFSLEQTSTGLSLSIFPISWIELTTSYYRNRYNEDVETIKARLNRSEFIKSLFSNVQETLDSLSYSSKSFSLRVLPISWLDTTFTRTYSDDLVSDTQYFVDSLDIGFYYFPRVFVFLTTGEHYSSISTSKTSFSEISVQFNF